MKTKRAPMNQKSFFSMTMLTAFAVVTLTGCGQDGSTGSAGSLTAPSLSTQGGLTAIDDGDANAGNGDPSGQWVPFNDENPTPNAVVNAINAPMTGEAVEVSALIGKSGGTIIAGRHTLQITPNTFKNDTMITLRDLTGMTGRVECEVLPADLAFSKNPHLTSNFSDIMPTLGCTMFEIADVGGSEIWSSVGGSATGTGVKTNLAHFGHFAPATTS